MPVELGVLGTGHIASAILDGVFQHGILAPAEVMVADHHPDRTDRYGQLGCHVASSSGEIAGAPRILCSVRPQEFPDAAGELGSLPADRLVISVMAGIDSTAIRAALGGSCRVVRAMPNIGSSVGQSMTVISPGDGAVDDDMVRATNLFEAIGRTARIDEELMSAATAVSGSGPGWVFLLAASMIEGARAVGFDEATADTIVRQTLRGAAEVLSASSESVDSLLKGVAVRGGTTEAGLEVMRQRDVAGGVRDGIIAARDHGEQLRRGD